MDAVYGAAVRVFELYVEVFYRRLRQRPAERRPRARMRARVDVHVPVRDPGQLVLALQSVRARLTRVRLMCASHASERAEWDLELLRPRSRIRTRRVGVVVVDLEEERLDAHLVIHRVVLPDERRQPRP